MKMYLCFCSSNETEEINFRNTFRPDNIIKHLCFLGGKSHLTFCKVDCEILQDTGYPICYDLPLFATIRNCSHLIHAIHFTLFGTIRCLLFTTICYSVFEFSRHLL